MEDYLIHMLYIINKWSNDNKDNNNKMQTYLDCVINRKKKEKKNCNYNENIIKLMACTIILSLYSFFDRIKDTT